MPIIMRRPPKINSLLKSVHALQESLDAAEEEELRTAAAVKAADLKAKTEAEVVRIIAEIKSRSQVKPKKPPKIYAQACSCNPYMEDEGTSGLTFIFCPSRNLIRRCSGDGRPRQPAQHSGLGGLR